MGVALCAAAVLVALARGGPFGLTVPGVSRGAAAGDSDPAAEAVRQQLGGGYEWRAEVGFGRKR